MESFGAIMKWTVVWQPSASNRLAELWNTASDRAAVARAADRIDWLLQRDPLHQGEAREGDVRILIEDPLAVYYTVSEPDCMVSVFDVWLWTTDPS
jgi:hypothetical protein